MCFKLHRRPASLFLPFTHVRRCTTISFISSSLHRLHFFHPSYCTCDEKKWRFILSCSADSPHSRRRGRQRASCPRRKYRADRLPRRQRHQEAKEGGVVSACVRGIEKERDSLEGNAAAICQMPPASLFFVTDILRSIKIGRKNIYLGKHQRNKLHNPDNHKHSTGLITKNDVKASLLFLKETEYFNFYKHLLDRHFPYGY